MTRELQLPFAGYLWIAGGRDLLRGHTLERHVSVFEYAVQALGEQQLAMRVHRMGACPGAQPRLVLPPHPGHQVVFEGLACNRYPAGRGIANGHALSSVTE